MSRKPINKVKDQEQDQEQKQSGIEEKIYKIRTKFATQAHLCGYSFDFKKKNEKDVYGNLTKVGCVYELNTKDYIAREGDDKGKVSVLPEIIKKLTDPLNQIVEIIG